MTETDERCACGKPLHYSDPKQRAYVESLVATFGPHVTIRTPDGVWRVPRHYIALHSLSGGQLPSLAALHNWTKLPL